MESESKFVAARGWGKGRMGSDYLKDKMSFWGDERFVAGMR